ncbi:MAG: glycerol kinase GlpK [Pseudomonadota bacterium]
MGSHILAIDQGTTSSRAILFAPDFKPVTVAQREITQHYPKSGWVEHDADEIWQATLTTIRTVLNEMTVATDEIAAVGITNQRETVVLWDRKTGVPLHEALVWQDRRTAATCRALKQAGHEPMVQEKTGLLLDPYFSATKLAWLLDEIPGAREQAEAGALAFGTIDSWLIWQLTGGREHATDITNASRTLLFNIHTQEWDADLLTLFDIPRSLLPEVRDCDGDFGSCDPSLFGHAFPIRGVAGDQQAATIGQACFTPGSVKSTYGTGCFILMNIGDEPVLSKNRLLTTIAYRLGGQTAYGLEGSIFIAGAAVQWLRDGLKIIEGVAQSGDLAAAADDEQDIVMVPAFTGLGAPHWDAEARGAIFGLTRATGPAELCRAALESVCHQTADLLTAMVQDRGVDRLAVLRVDGGMVASDWTMQRLAELTDTVVDRPQVLETTALGAAWLAGQAVGVWPDAKDFAERWALDQRFEPSIDLAAREKLRDSWHDAVSRTLTKS